MTPADSRRDVTLNRIHQTTACPRCSDPVQGHPGHPLIQCLQYLTKFSHMQLYAANCSSM